MRLLACLSWFLAAGFVTAGCAATPTELGTNREAIVGGTTDTGDPSVVLMIASDNQSESLCTGNVVSPHVVLTAAHCVDPATVGKNQTFQIFLGDDLNNQTQANDASLYVNVKTTSFDSQFNPNQLQNGHDVGIVVTETALALAPLPLNRTPLVQADDGVDLRFVGYGISSGNDTQGTTAGTKRQTMAALASYSSLFLQFTDPKHGTCEGDSGGPAFLTQNGVEVIAGITSFGPEGCTTGGTDTNIETYVAFIDGFIQTYDPQQMMVNPTVDMATAPQPSVDLAQQAAANADLSQPVVASVDLATAPSPGEGDDAGTTPARGTGKVGSVCHASTDCASALCAFTTTDTGYCTTTCNLDDADSCPSTMTCEHVDSSDYCVRGGTTSGNPSGCAVGGHSDAPWAAWLLVPLAMWIRRRRRV